jgi:competence protein ComEC
MPIVYPITIMYLIGILIGRAIDAPLWLTGPAALVLVMAALAARGRDRVFQGFLIVAVFFGSWFLFGVNDVVYRQSTLTHYLELREDQDRVEKVWGTIVRERITNDGRVYATVQSDEVVWSGGRRLKVSGLVELRLPEDIRRAPEYGERWEFEGILTPAGAMRANRYEYFRSGGIAAGMFLARHGACERAGRANRASLMWIGATLQRRFLGALEKNVAPEYSQVLGMMVLGTAQKMDPDLYETFRRAGLVHILVVSGMNVWIMLGTFMFLGFLWNRRPLVSFFVLSAVLVLYYAVTGGGPSVMRATLMGLIFLVSLLRGSDYTARTALFIAALMMMVMNPFVVFQIGAQLTFLASAGVVFVYPALSALVPGRAWWARVIKVFMVSIGAQLPIYPLLAYYFNQFCVVSPISNLIVVPLAGILLPLGLLTGIAGLIPGKLVVVPAFAAGIATWVVLALTRFFANLPFSNIEVASPSPVWLALYGAGLVLFIWTLKRMRDGTDRQITNGWLGIAALGVLLAAGPLFHSPMRGIRVTFIDVGDGDSVLIEAPAEARGGRIFRLLVDGGGSWGDTSGYYDPGERVVGKLLRSRGIRRLDAVMLSHPDADHMNGLPWVLKNLKVDRFMETGLMVCTACNKTGNRDICRIAESSCLTYCRCGSCGYGGDETQLNSNQFDRYGQLLDTVKERGTEYVLLENGTTFRLKSGVEINVLNPDNVLFGRYRNPERFVKRNNLSLVTRISYGAASVLMTGDIGNEAEKRIAREYGRFLKSSLMKSPHHGSGTSSSVLFLDWVRPSMVVISSGGPKYYGHPSDLALQAYRRLGAKVFRTDINGNVTCELNRNGGVRCRPQYAAGRD